MFGRRRSERMRHDCYHEQKHRTGVNVARPLILYSRIEVDAVTSQDRSKIGHVVTDSLPRTFESHIDVVIGEVEATKHWHQHETDAQRPSYVGCGSF